MSTRAALVALAIISIGPALAGGRSGGEWIGQKAPDFAVDAWLNSEPLSLEDLAGKVVLVEFWTLGCYNCHNVEPYVKKWHTRFAERGLVIVGVHTPEFSYEGKLAKIRRYVEDREIRYPVAVDTGWATWKRWGNRYWPAFYLIDSSGVVRHIQFGEGHYDVMAQKIEELLKD